MKHSDWKKLMIAGLSTGLLVSGQISAQDKTASTPTKNSSASASDNPNDGNMNYHLMSEEELLMELSPEGSRMYKSLPSEGKVLALNVASAQCNNTNKCSGLNACAGPKNACAGQGSCRGQGKCAVSDKNLAVKLVYNKLMKEKRIQATQQQ